MHLDWRVRELFAQWLAEHFPRRSERVLAMMRSCRGGRLYDADFATRMRGTGPVADLLAQCFALCCRRLGLATAPPALSVHHFQRPGQLPLF